MADLNTTILRAASGGDVEEDSLTFLPKEFVCPITQELMVDPVIAEDGFSYERISMERWFSTGKTRSPVTSERMEGQSLTPNKVMKAMIQNYRRDLGTRLLQACNALTEEIADGAASEPLTTRTLAAFHEGGADLNVRDEDGNTPLLLLLQAGQLSLARELLEYGARASQRNDLGTAPLDLCISLRDRPLEGRGPAENNVYGSSNGVDSDAANQKVGVSEWNSMIRLLEARTTVEAIEDEEKEKIRKGNQLRQRQRQADLDQVSQYIVAMGDVNLKA